MNLEIPKVMQRILLRTFILFIGLSGASVSMVMAADNGGDNSAPIEDRAPHSDEIIRSAMQHWQNEAAAKQAERERSKARNKEILDRLAVQRNMEIWQHGAAQAAPYNPYGTEAVNTLTPSQASKQALNRNDDGDYAATDEATHRTVERTTSHGSNLDADDPRELEELGQAAAEKAARSQDELVANKSMSSTAQAVERMNQATKKGWNFTANSLDGSLANMKNFVEDQDQMSETAKAVKQLQDAHTNPRSEKPDHQQLSQDMVKNKYNFERETLESYHKRMAAKNRYSYTEEPLSNFQNELKNSRQGVASTNSRPEVANPPPSANNGSNGINTSSASNSSTTLVRSSSRRDEDSKSIWNIPPLQYGYTAESTKACYHVNRTNASLNLEAIKDDKQKRIIERCLTNRQDQSFECVHFLATAAEKAFSTKPECKGKLTAEKLLCVINSEVSKPETYRSCNRHSACGITQITKSGAKTVKRGLTMFDLPLQFDTYLDLIGKSDFKQNKCKIENQTARDRDLAVVMGATHLCAQYVVRPTLSSTALFTEYNLGDEGAKKSKWSNRYGRRVAECEKRANQQLASHEMKIALSASCHASDSCPKLSGGSNSFSSRQSTVGWKNFGAK